MTTAQGSSAIPSGAAQWNLPKLNGPQASLVMPLLQRTAKRLICFEGAIRLGKSWGALIAVWCLALLFPGIRIMISRWKQEDVDGQLTEVWEAVSNLFPKAWQPKWNAAKHAYEFANGSIVYKKSLKSAEGEARDSKWRGMTLAVIVIDQFEECPKYVLDDIKGRLSQSRHAITQKPFRYPLHLILVLNSIDDDHWLADYFPTDNHIAGRQYLTGTVWDNRENLGEEVIEGLETDYPVSDPRRRTLLEGKRGIAIDGEPCYQGYFDPKVHVSSQVRFNRYRPLLEGWDFSYSHPAVIWMQWDDYTGSLNVLGGVQGFSMYLETFAPKVLEIRQRWFPECGIPREALDYLPHLNVDATAGTTDVWSWCDPSGQSNTSGSHVTAVTSLNNFGVYPQSPVNGNAATDRYAAIQSVASMMLRTVHDGGRGFRLNPQCIEIRRGRNGAITETPRELVVDALSLAYVWDDKAPPDNNPNVRRPKKNHRGDKYSHLMNGLEYVVLGQKLVNRPRETDRTRERHRLQHQAEEVARQLRRETGRETLPEAMARLAKLNRGFRDYDPADRLYGKGQSRSRAGHAGSGWGSRRA